MTTTTSTANAKAKVSVLCPECRRENEPERVYCHDCGTRLDRSAVHVKKEPIEDTHKRVKRMFDPQRARIKALLRRVFDTIAGAGLLAMVVVMFLPPDVPPPNKNQVLVSSLRGDLETMATKGLPAQKQLSEEDANAFIASALKPKQTALDKPFLPFKRALMTFREGRGAITVERSLSGYWSVYTSCSVAPVLKNGKLLGKIESGHIGRLPVHPKLAQFMGVLFGDVVAVLERDVKAVSKLGAVEVHDKSVTLGAPTPTPAP